MESVRECVIVLTPDNTERQMDVKTGGVTALEILEMLQPLEKHFARKICEEYADLTGQRIEDLNEDQDFDNYVKFLRANKQ